jgi:DNA-binding XRE family transcriptional regulator
MAESMFDPILEAGINQTELAHLAGVCRLTAFNWVNENAKPHRIHADKIETLLNKVKELVEEKKLPLNGRFRGAKRKAELHRLVYGDVTK